MDFSGSNATATDPAHSPLRSFWRSGWCRVLLAGAALLTLGLLLYLEQNQSGKAAWLKHKHALEAKGEKLDWNSYIPAQIPDAENIFAAPEIQDAFVKGGSGRLTSPLSPSVFSTGQRPLWRKAPIAALTVISSNQPFPTAELDLALYYDAPHVRLAGTNDELPPSEPPIPLIVIDYVPLTDAIRNLAGAANIQYVVDPETLPHTKGNPTAQPTVSARWENVTARHALKGLLKNYNLALVEGPGGKPAHIIPRDPAKPKLFIDAEARQKIGGLVTEALAPMRGARTQLILHGSQGLTFFKAPLEPFKPVHILVRADAMPDREELTAFFSGAIGSGQQADAGPLEVKPTGSNTYSATISPRLFDAAEYLEWSDQFEGVFDLLREALKRPSARMNGNYEKPARMPVQNFVAMRLIAQALAQRAQCCLLLDHPEDALRELTLLHDLRRILEPARPTDGVTLVAAMINVAITGVYEDAIADGLRMRAWKEPQLRAIEKQLAEVDLMPVLVQSLRTERAAMCRTMEMTPPQQIHSLFTFSPGATFSQRIRDPRFWILTAAPRGWVYDNMVTVSSLHQTFLESYNPALGTIRPRDFENASQNLEKKFSRWSPRNFMAAMAVPNFSRAWLIAASNQDKARQALIACALERYWLAHNAYPEALASLVPECLPQLPVDVIGRKDFLYKCKSDDHFLLYSVGWNEKDDGGVEARASSGAIDMRNGDWVWLPEPNGGS